MPIDLPPLSRRSLLGGAIAFGAAAMLPKCFAADVQTDPHRLAILSDVHIAADKATKTSGTVPWETMAQAVKEIASMEPRAGRVIVNGDCAYFYGKPEDYARFIEAVAPLREMGLPIHLTLGNHDSRVNFLKALPADDARVNEKELADRVVNIIGMERANIFMLDSLGVTAKVEGAVGAAQLAWLAKALDARKDKPAIVFVHHNPDLRAAEKVTGLLDSKELLDLLLPRKQVKALFFGHSHTWNHMKREDLRLGEKGGTVELHCLDKGHSLNGEKVELGWR